MSSGSGHGSKKSAQQKRSFWPVRKLLILFKLQQDARRKEYSIRDLMYPFYYPRSIRTSSWEGYRVLATFEGLKNCGVKVEKVLILSTFFGSFPAFSPELFLQEGGKWNKDGSGIYIPYKKFMKCLKHQVVSEIDKEGEGTFLDPNMDNPARIPALVIPASLRLTIVTDKKASQKKMNEYLDAFRNKLLRAPGAAFSREVLNEILRKFFSFLKDLQGDEIVVRFRISEDESPITPQDSLFLYIKNEHPQVYSYWKNEHYLFKAFEQILLLQKKGFLKVVETSRKDIKPDMISCTSENFEDAHGFNNVEVKMDKRIKLLSPRKKLLSKKARPIHTVEVLESNESRFYVYVNHNYFNRKTMSKKRPSGKLIYLLATQGWAEHIEFEPGYNYLTKKPESQLFKDPGILFTQIVQIDDEGIIEPAKHVSFKRITEKDIERF